MATEIPRTLADAPEPPIASDATTPDTQRVSLKPSAPLVGLFVLALLGSFHLAGAFFVPLVLAFLFNLLLSPVVRALARAHLPPPAGAALVLLTAVGAMAYGAYSLSGPARQWVAGAPQNIAKARTKLGNVLRPMEEMRRTAEQMQRAAAPGDSTAPSRTVTVQDSGWGSRLFGTTQAFAVGAFEMLVLLYFLLAAGPMLIQKVVKVLPSLREKRTAVQIVKDVESSVSRYLVTIATINIAEGAILAGVMYWLGMPNPPLWGALAAVLILIPYIGAVTMVGVLFVVSITTFDSVSRAVAAPLIFIAIDTIQANFIAPHILGRRMELNPVAIFMSIMLWGGVWGIPGVFMAVPLLVTMKIFCDHIDALTPVGEFLAK